MTSNITLILAALAAVVFASTATNAQIVDCPFVQGICPITLDNVLDVAYHDLTDPYSCQRTCRLGNPNCNFFTIFDDSELAKKKCFHFAKCGIECEECITGPTLPEIDDCIVKKKTLPIPAPKKVVREVNGYVCDMNRFNIVDIGFYDLLDEFSCPIECDAEEDCNFHTTYIPEGGSQKKCFLFKECGVPEDCASCDTVPKNA
jgi:hypothetical protein